MRTFPLLAVLTVSVGCYNYVPLTTQAPPPGTRAQVVLTDAGTVDLARWVGPSPETIEGSVVVAADTSLTLAVTRLQRRSGVEEFWKGESVTIPRNAMASVARREFSWQRTALLGGGIVAAGFALAGAFGGLDEILGRRDPGTGSGR